jgi:hypothetical protein
MPLRWLAVVGCLAVLAGCSGSNSPSTGPTSPTSTTPTAAAGLQLPSGQVPQRAAAALGDLRTLDPCSLLPQAGPTPAGPATFGDPQSMDYCVVIFQTPAGDVELHLGELVDGQHDAAPPRATQPLDGGAVVVQGAQGATSCQDRVDFADHLSLLSVALPPYGTDVVGTCAIADVGLTGALVAIAGGKVAHRSYPARSFGLVDPCGALTRAAVARTLPALAKTPVVSHPAKHQCEFGTRGASTTYAALVLGAAYQRFDGGPTSTTITVAGHRVVLIPTQPTGRPTECTGYGPHIAFPSRSGQPAMEMAELHVSLPDGAAGAQACRDVRALAATVFARLP